MKKSNSIRISENCTIVKIDLRKCVADPTYQRDICYRMVAAIVEAFNLLYIRLPLLSKREGNTYAIINGQHTIAALLAKDITHYYCQVYSNLTLQEEADLFHATNSRFKSMVGWAKFKAALAAGHVVETAIKRICDSMNATLGMNGNAHPDFKTPQVLVGIYKKRYESTFRRMVTVLKICFTQSKRDKGLREDAKRNEFQRGLAQFLASHPGLSPAEFQKKIGTMTADTLYDKAINRAGECRRSRSIERFIVQILNEQCGFAVSPAIYRKAA